MAAASDWQERWHGLRSILGAKWAVHLLRTLATEPRGFNDLKREFDGLTATMLSRRLSDLTCHGLVTREVAQTTPPTTTYALSDDGQAMVTTLQRLDDRLTVADCENPDCATGPREPCITAATCCE